MRIKQICVVTLFLLASIAIEMRAAWAQVVPQPPKPSAPIPLEMIGEPGGGAPSPTATPPANSAIPGKINSVSPSQQGSNRRDPGVNSRLSQLRNPFDYGHGEQPVHNHAAPLGRSTSNAYASPQVPNYYGLGGRAMLGQLRNPFDGGASPQTQGRFDYATPQYSTAPGLGAVPRGALAPGAMSGVPTPGTTAEGAVPSAPTPGTIAEGAVPGAPTPGTTAEGGTPGTPTPPGAGATGPGATGADAFGAAATTAGPGYGGALEAAVTPFAMIGDLSPISIGGLATTAATKPVPTPGPPAPPGPRGALPIYAAARNVKVSENQSPRPQDRIYFNFNYYNNVDSTINRRDLSPVTQMKAYTYLFGIEKTFNDGKGSIGFRVPLDTLTANSSQNVLSTPTSTAAGNLSIIAKYILEQNVKTGSLISAGLAITAPTGPSRFAGGAVSFPAQFGLFSAVHRIHIQPRPLVHPGIQRIQLHVQY